MAETPTSTPISTAETPASAAGTPAPAATPASAAETPVEHPSIEQTMVLILGYNGTDFSGFAEQKEPHIRTVAKELRRALETFLRREVDITCAGRTDAGVHALGQVVSLPVYDEETKLEARRIKRALSAIASNDISIREVMRAPAGFSARFDALARHYRYRISDSDTRPTLTQAFCWWHKTPLDIDAMSQAAQSLIGEHDFTSFCKVASAVGKSTTRNLISLDIGRNSELGEELIYIDICANAFLHSMVRTIVGTLAEVGTGRKDCAWVSQVLSACDRKAAGQTAPAAGLEFMSVDYEADAFMPWDAQFVH
ncbi:MAG: tRNA pseudouridine(38-40) synthase TruA [Atopobiaceae bacterium]|nr:tRNA pseudouridine(38-40) synthase TruA [Atopobiaceae bacterium]